MDNIKIIGHRGNLGHSTENSMEAILNCSTNENIDGTEFDIRPTKDDEIVIMHNATINGTTHSKGRIQDLNLRELKNLKFRTQLVDRILQRIYNGFNKDKYFYNQYRALGRQSSSIATFEEVMANYSPNKHMLIELKGMPGEYPSQKQLKFEENIVDILREFNYQRRDIALEGYNFEALFRIKSKLPDLQVIALINKRGSLNPLDMNFDGVSLEYVLLNEKVIQKVIKNKMTLYSWDDKKPIQHYNRINKIVPIWETYAETSKSSLYVVNDFPEKAKQYIKK